MKLSVIIPVYNVEKYLKKCVESIVNQTFKDLEIILVDDGSTDSSGAICDELCKNNCRIKVIHKKNGGLSSARNAGLKNAIGDYISFIDSDDFVEPDMYSIMIEALKRTEKDIASCGRILDLWGEREKIEFSLDKEKIYDRQEAIKEVLLLRNIDVSSCDKVYKRSLFDNISYPEGKISEDAAIIFQILDESNGIVHIGKPMYHYIYRKNSISKAKYSHKFYDSYLNCLNTREYINNKYPDLSRFLKVYCSKVCCSLLQCIAVDKKTIKENINDYKDYKAMFNNGYIDMILYGKMSFKQKIKSIFVLTNTYPLFNKLKG